MSLAIVFPGQGSQSVGMMHGFAGVPGVELTSWGGVSVPAGTPEPIVAQIQAAFEKAMHDPKVIQALEAQGGQVLVREGAAYRNAFVKEMAFTEAMMKQVGLQPL